MKQLTETLEALTVNGLLAVQKSGLIVLGEVLFLQKKQHYSETLFKLRSSLQHWKLAEPVDQPMTPEQS